MRLFDNDASQISDPFLRRAYELAESGRGTTSPNPVVGCVIVRDGEVVGIGAHLTFGGAHAEVIAIADAGDAACGATAYVTLEPCNHHGKTPPCTVALLHAGIARVVIGMPDPNVGVSGGGAAVLAAGGVDVEFSPDPSPFERQNEAWLHYVETSRPWIRVKTALSLDGRTAMRDGERARISGPETDEITMRLRSMADAVLVGARTAEVDQPALTVRDPEGNLTKRQPIRVVMGRNAAPKADLLTDSLGRTIALLPQEWTSDVADGVEVLGYDSSAGIAGAVETLGAIGITHLLIEAGGGLLTALWETDLIDEMVLYHSGGMAGRDAPEAFYGHHQGETDALQRRMTVTETGIAGGDAVTLWRRASESSR